MIRTMVDNDRERVSEIYKQGMEGGTATFNTEYPSFEEWAMFSFSPPSLTTELDARTKTSSGRFTTKE